MNKSVANARRLLLAVVALAAGACVSCSGDDDSPVPPGPGGAMDSGADAEAGDAAVADAISKDSPADAYEDRDGALEAEADAPPAPCPDDMALVGEACVDLYEAPNRVGELPLVMYHLVEADAWCTARGKRLCYDDEWQTACEGPDGWNYPYGDSHQPGTCNDDKTWLTYNQTLLNGWPSNVSTPEIESLGELLDAARAGSASAKAAADHIEWLYQGAAEGEHPACTNDSGVFDLCGNVEEWTLRRDGGATDFHGNLKGRYWAESRTCQSNVTVHGDYFRFYEIGFRCCRDPN